MNGFVTPSCNLPHSLSPRGCPRYGPLRDFDSNEKIISLQKLVDLVECNKSRNIHITQNVRPSECCVIAYAAHGQKRLVTTV